MPAITVGYPEFKARLLKLQRVVNRSSLVDAVCIVGATVMLASATTTVAGLAFAGAPLAWIHLGVYAAAATTCFAVAWRLHTNWLDLQATAVHVDQQAGMHARLATMLAHPSPDTGSQLRTILLWEIFDLSTQWELPRIAPRRIRRPAIALAIALFTFALARFLQPSPGQRSASEIGKSRVSTVTAANTKKSQPGQFASRRIGSEVRTLGGINHARPARHQDATRGRSDGSADASAGEASRGDGSAARTGGGRGKSNTEQGRQDHAAPGGVTASGPDADDPDEKDPSATKTQASDRSNAGSNAERRAQEASLAAVDAPSRQSVASMPTSAARRDAATPAKPGQAGGMGGGSNTAARSTRNAERIAGGTVLGNKGTSPLPHHDKVAPMVIRLHALAAGPAKSEPQSGRERTASAADDKRHEYKAEISASQADDSVFRRSAVTRHHQSLVRDIFTPDQE